MKKMEIFEPALCCPTGLCGVGIDPELLRISGVLSALEKNGIKVDRSNLSSAPQAFVDSPVAKEFITTNGVDGLPMAVVDGEVVITGRYPTNEEFISLLDIPEDFLQEREKKVGLTPKLK